MKYTILFSVVAGLLLLLLGYFYWPKEDPSVRFDRVKNATMEVEQLLLHEPAGAETVSINVSSDRPYTIQVSGKFTGVNRQDFSDLVKVNQLFRVGIKRKEQVLWSSAPMAIAVSGENDFSFECPLMLPKNTASGEYLVDCEYYFQSIKTTRIQVTR